MLIFQNNSSNTFAVITNTPSFSGTVGSYYMNIIAPNQIDTTTGITLTDTSSYPTVYKLFTVLLSASTIPSAATIHVQTEGLADYFIYAVKSGSTTTSEVNRGILKISGNSFSEYLKVTNNNTQKYLIYGQ